MTPQDMEELLDEPNRISGNLFRENKLVRVIVDLSLISDKDNNNAETPPRRHRAILQGAEALCGGYDADTHPKRPHIPSSNGRAPLARCWLLSHPHYTSTL